MTEYLPDIPAWAWFIIGAALATWAIFAWQFCSVVRNGPSLASKRFEYTLAILWPFAGFILAVRESGGPCLRQIGHNHRREGNMSWKDIRTAPVGQVCIVARKHDMARAFRNKSDGPWLMDTPNRVEEVAFRPTHWNETALMEPAQ